MPAELTGTAAQSAYGNMSGRSAAGPPQHLLYFRPLPHQHGSLRPGGQGTVLPCAAMTAA